LEGFHQVDKKYLWPHGLGPPLKNCRKRRFRKTRKKKYVEAPEIEKEVPVATPLCYSSDIGTGSYWIADTIYDLTPDLTCYL
jgi:hypothetical protein